MFVFVSPQQELPQLCSSNLSHAGTSSPERELPGYMPQKSLGYPWYDTNPDGAFVTTVFFPLCYTILNNELLISQSVHLPSPNNTVDQWAFSLFQTRISMVAIINTDYNCYDSLSTVGALGLELLAFQIQFAKR